MAARRSHSPREHLGNWAFDRSNARWAIRLAHREFERKSGSGGLCRNRSLDWRKQGTYRQRAAADPETPTSLLGAKDGESDRDEESTEVDRIEYYQLKDKIRSRRE